jgi:hypothetical protein
MVPHPRHGPGQGRFIAALGREIEEVVGANQNVEAARIAGIGALFEGLNLGRPPDTRIDDAEEAGTTRCTVAIFMKEATSA